MLASVVLGAGICTLSPFRLPSFPFRILRHFAVGLCATFAPRIKCGTMKQTTTLILLSLLIPILSLAQEAVRPTQNIRGRILDASSAQPIPFAAIVVQDMPQLGTTSDPDGNFLLPAVPVGRHTIAAEMVGYEPSILKEIMVSSGKETLLDIPMKESIVSIDEVTVRPHVNKEKPLNAMASTGARMLSVEEASRYAGGFSDPARLASSFAGVSSQGSTNGISIHGNAPYLLAWRIEGIEVPNPNHFSDITGAGGGVMSSLSAQVLGNSDFLTCAFPSEYGNAVSGVFDVKLRNGNSSDREHTFQFGTLGIDFASEGPIRKGGKASYIVNYRYSTMGLAQKMNFLDMGGQQMDYQDLNYKVNLPTKSAGTFSLWGTGFIDKYQTEEMDSVDWKTISDAAVSSADQKMIATGVNHRIFLSGGGQLSTSLALTHYYEWVNTECRDTTLRRESIITMHDGRKRQTNLIFDVAHTRKFSSRYTHKAGLTVTRTLYSSHLDAYDDDAQQLLTIYDACEDHTFAEAFTSHQINVSNQLTINAGLNASYLSINDTYTVEPRLGLRWQPTGRSTFAVGYGLHSRKGKNEFYYVVKDGKYVNHDIGMMRSHHFMLSFSQKLTENAIFKVEPFFQYTDKVPVEPGKSFSSLNFIDFYLDKEMTNTGKGRNYGVDITLERYLNNGWYYLFTTSVFDARFRDGMGCWRQSRFNRHVIANLLGGKEWMVGERKQNVFSVNGKLTWQGGERTSPVDMEATRRSKFGFVKYDNSRDFTLGRDPQLIYSFSIGYKINKARVSHYFFCDMISAKGVHGDSYNFRDDEIDDIVVKITLPNIGYKLEF